MGVLQFGIKIANNDIPLRIFTNFFRMFSLKILVSLFFMQLKQEKRNLELNHLVINCQFYLAIWYDVDAISIINL